MNLAIIGAYAVGFVIMMSVVGVITLLFEDDAHGLIIGFFTVALLELVVIIEILRKIGEI